MDQTIDTQESPPVNTTVASGETNFEAEARRTKWVPKEEYPGDPQKWVDAETWVKRGDLKHQLRQTQRELEEVKQAAQEWKKFNEQATQREVAEWKAKYEEAIQAKKQALSENDGDKFIEAEATQRRLESERPQPKQEVKEDPEFAAWKAENAWYGTDKAKTMKAMLIGTDLVNEGLRGKALYEKVSERLAEHEKEMAGSRPSPQRAGKPTVIAKGVRSYDNLLPEHQQNCDRQYKYFAEGKTTPEAWRKNWVQQASENMFRG